VQPTITALIDDESNFANDCLVVDVILDVVAKNGYVPVIDADCLSKLPALNALL
jgi:hypothetical protein